MPGMSLCGRQWALASDDLPALAFLGALFHGAWLLLLIVFSIIALSLQQPKNCEEVAIFMSCLLFSTLVSTISDLLIIRNGLKGTILQPSSRRYVEIVMYVLAANFLMKIGIIGYGTYLVFFQQPRCLEDTSELDKLMRAVIISTWVIALLYLTLFFASYQAFPKNSVLQWKRRIRCMNWCCCANFDKDESESLAKMALVFDRFFNPMDFSATDTLASTILAAKRQSFLRHRSESDTEELPTSMDVFAEPAHRNGVRVGDRRLNDQQMELQQRRLMTVSEDVEMVMMEQGETLHEDAGLTSDDGQSPVNTISPSPLEIEVSNEQFDREVADIGPHHRRRNAFIFSEEDLARLRFETHNYVTNAEGSDSSFRESTSSPGSAAGTDSATMNSMEHQADADSVHHAPSISEQDTAREASRSEGRSSVETVLSWGDDFCGPFLTPSSHGLSSLASKSPTVDYETLERMHLYHRYALAAYGALLYMASGKRVVDVFSRFCGLCITAAPPNSLHSLTHPGHHEHSPAHSQRGSSLKQRLNEEAVLRYGFKKENILYRSHEDVLAGHLPYFVALDHNDKALVVAVRGTWSWSDLVTDFLIHPEPLDKDEAEEVNQLLADLRGFDSSRAGCLPEVSVHSGMLRSARGLISNMQEVGMLEFLETGSCEQATKKIGMDLPDMQRWRFVMTGHSLGAGVVSLATLLLKSRFPHRKIECFAISPPGCTMSPELATAISPFCYSVVHGKDIVPRISVSTIERLRDQMVRAATLCRPSKLRVLLSGLLNTKWTEDALFFPPEEVDAEPLNAFSEYRSAVQTSNLEDLTIAREFIPPGKIAFLRPRKTRADQSSSAFQRDFEAVWISGRDLMQEGILLSLFMFKDHFPYFSIECLKDVMDRRGKF